jgi:branched-chain amino acid transport system permease protein
LGGVAPFVACVFIAAAMQFFIKPLVGPYWAKILLDIGVNTVLAVSLTIVNGFTGQFSMGHAGFLAAGGYAAAMVSYYTSLLAWGSSVAKGGMLSGMPRTLADGLPLLTVGDGLFVLSLLIGGLFAALLGVLVGLPSLRLKGDYLAIVTLGFGEIVRVCIQQTGPLIRTAEEARDAGLAVLPTRVGGALGFTDIPTYTSLFWAYLFALVTIVIALRLKYSTHGRAMLSIREDEIASEAMGVNTTRYKVWAFVIAAFFAGIAGGLFAHTLGVGLSPQAAGFQKSFDIIIMVVLGGLGSITGAALAAIVVTILPEYLRAIEQYRMIVFALALVLIMIFRPKGLLGVREVWEVWSFVKFFGRKGGAR